MMNKLIKSYVFHCLPRGDQRGCYNKQKVEKGLKKRCEKGLPHFGWNVLPCC